MVRLILSNEFFMIISIEDKSLTDSLQVFEIHTGLCFGIVSCGVRIIPFELATSTREESKKLKHANQYNFNLDVEAPEVALYATMQMQSSFCSCFSSFM